MSTDITQTRADGIHHVQLTRIAKKNALSLEMLDELAEIGTTLAQDKSIRAVILSGEGGVFSAGIDLTAIMMLTQDIEGLRTQILDQSDPEFGNRFQRPATIWSGLPVPVIAALDGYCFGAAMQLALGADFRIAAPETKLSILEAKWGLIPDMGLTKSLPHLMRADVAKELLMTGRILDATEARDIGLITRIADDPHRAALDLAQSLVGCSPDAVAASKSLVNQTWARAESSLETEAALQVQIIGSKNQMEKAMSVIEKRAPKFKA